MGRYDARTALVVVDLQNDFADPAGSLAVQGAGDVVTEINVAVEQAHAAGSLIVATQDWHPESTPHFAKDGGTWPVHCVGGTWGAELFPAFRLPATAPRVRKGQSGEDGYSGFTMRDPRTGEETSTELESLLREANIERVVVCGLATDYCVRATALDAVNLGFDVTVLAKACAPVNLEPHHGDEALSEMADAGVEVA
ncbi:MAG TPA: isochorismatase family protein [Gemmatimonadales bacterium]|nr:isochorismatase family protein [Candidatus Limnocylindria bacterium]HEU4827897.1 isochorismatase family protein [Gemmatimonadales bacterium]